MKKKIMLTLAGLVGLVVVMLVAIFVWPLSFSKDIANDAELRIQLTRTGIENGEQHNTIYEYKYQPGSDEWLRIKQILSKYTYHRIIQTFTNDTEFDGRGTEYWLLIYSVENQLVSGQILLGQPGKLAVNGHVYRIGFWGTKSAQSLSDEIRSVLGH